MAEFDRRSFLGASFGLAATASMPEWLARAFAIQESVSTWRLQQLRAAIERARKDQKPLLVMVVPDQNDRDVRGKWFGAMLTTWHYDSSWLLASCEFACATTAEFGQVAGKPFEGAPLFVLADVGGTSANPIARTTPIECSLPIVPSGRASSRDSGAKTKREGLQAMRPALLAGAEGHGLSLDAAAAAAVRRLTAAQRQMIDAWIVDASAPLPPAEVLASGAAEILRRFAALPELPGDKVRKLRDALLARWRGPMAGARWQEWRRCSTEFVHATKAEVEAEARAEADRMAAEAKARAEVKDGKLTEEEFRDRFVIRRYGCGMGYVGDVCMQFLEFWTAGD
ncbi:MAG: hypothetical protein JNK15_21145 [Planctomycetes bacterium]|nr:hypothetical protein [Planctomycetota bacterium]